MGWSEGGERTCGGGGWLVGVEGVESPMMLPYHDCSCGQFAANGSRNVYRRRLCSLP